MALDTKLKRGFVVGRWELGRSIGRGGQAEVWEARPDSGHSPPRALKVSFASDQKSRDRFRQEVELLRKLSHPNVLPVFDADLSWTSKSPDGAVFSFYVGELCEGALPDIPRLRDDPIACMRLFREACDAIDYLHHHDPQILHRDIKPANFLLAREPVRLVVADLGIAKRVDAQVGLTETHEVVGSPFYRAPETHYGAPDHPRIDVYSLGRVAEWMFTGRDPDSLEARSSPRGRELSDSACEAIDAVVRKACSEASARFQDVDALRSALPQLVVDVREPLQAPPAVGLPAEVFKSVSDAVRQKDDIGARRLIRAVRDAWVEPLKVTRTSYEHRQLLPDVLLGLGRDAATILAPTLAATLAVHEAGRADLFPLGLLLGALTDVPGWNYGGLSPLVALPRLLLFVTHWVVGAACMSNGDAAGALTGLMTPIHAWDDKRPGPLWKFHDVTGWPDTLSHDAMISWKFLKELPQAQPWLLSVFGSPEAYSVALCSYSLLTTIVELADTHRSADGLAVLSDPNRQARLDVPPFAYFESGERMRTAWRTLFSYTDTKRLAELVQIDAASLRAAWPVFEAKAVGRFLGAMSAFRFMDTRLEVP